MQPGREAGEARRILLVAPNWLGDVLMSLPLLDWLAAARSAPGGPRFTLTVAVRAAWAPLLAGDPRADALVVTSRPGRHSGWAGVARQAAQWRGGRYDAALLGPPSLRAAAVARLAGIPVRIGHAGDLRRPLLTTALPRGPRGALHYSEEMLQLGRALAEAWQWPAATVSAADAGGSRRLLAPAQAARKPADGRPVWGLGIGATFGPAKTWPTARAAELVRAIVSRRRARVLVLGDAAAAPLVAALREATSDLAWSAGEEAASASTADVVDLAGATDLPAVVGWLRACEAFVGSDSGLMHLAAALGTPTLGLFGSSNPDWTRPLGPRAAAMAADGFPCRPCYRRTCNQPRFCLDALAGREVFEAALALVGADGAGPRHEAGVVR